MMATIGETLKKARESKRLSLESVFRATKINPKILEALEADEFNKLAGTLYVKSFLKKYAEFLGLNSNEIVSSYLALNPPIPLASISENKEYKFLNIPKTRIIVLILGIFILFSLFKLLSHSKARFPRPAERKEIVQIKPGDDLPIPKGENLILKIKAQKDTWLQLKTDGKIVFQHILAHGKEESWQAKDNFELWVGDASSLDLSLNGRPLGSLGYGVKKGIIIDHRGLKIEP